MINLFSNQFQFTQRGSPKSSIAEGDAVAGEEKLAKKFEPGQNVFAFNTGLTVSELKVGRYPQGCVLKLYCNNVRPR